MVLGHFPLWTIPYLTFPPRLLPLTGNSPYGTSPPTLLGLWTLVGTGSRLTAFKAIFPGGFYPDTPKRTWVTQNLCEMALFVRRLNP